MAVFNIFHISDLHIGAQPHAVNIKTLYDRLVRPHSEDGESAPIYFRSQTTYSLEICKKLARFLLDNSADKDLLVISGDLACSGERSDLLSALDFFDGVPNPEAILYWQTNRLKPTISDLEIPVLLMPGNHDRYRGKLGLAGGVDFDSVFRHHWGNPNPFVLSRVVELDGDILGVIAVDFCLQRNSDASSLAGIPGQGIVTDRVLELLRTETGQLRREFPGIGLIWMFHFAPSNICNDANLTLLNCQEVMREAVSHGIQLILCGHVHQAMTVSRADGLVIVSAGTSTAMWSADGNWIHHLQINAANGVAALVSQINYRWSSRGSFVKAP